MLTLAFCLFGRRGGIKVAILLVILALTGCVAAPPGMVPNVPASSPSLAACDAAAFPPAAAAGFPANRAPGCGSGRRPILLRGGRDTVEGLSVDRVEMRERGFRPDAEEIS